MIPVSFVAMTLMAVGVAFLAAALRGLARGQIHAGEMRPSSRQVVSRRRAAFLLFILVCLLLGLGMLVAGAALALRASSPGRSNQSLQDSVVTRAMSLASRLPVEAHTEVAKDRSSCYLAAKGVTAVGR